MAARADSTDEPPRKRSRKGIFNFKRTEDLSSAGPSEGLAPTSQTSTGDTRGIVNKKDGLHNFGVALDLLKSVGDGTEILAPLKAVCGGLRILVDTAQAVQQNDEDIQELYTTLRLQLNSLEQQDETFATIQSQDAKIFVESLKKYIQHLSRVQEVLDRLNNNNNNGKGAVKGFLKKAAMVHSVGEDIKDCRRQLDGSFRLFMNSVMGFIAHQAVLLRNSVADMRMRDEEKKANDALSQLPCSDARGNQHDSCLDGTREDVLKEITEWATDSTDKPLFCLVDQAGTGKSTISFHVAQKWEKEGLSTARFFFSLTKSVVNGTDLATTLARDMASSKNSPSLRSFILDAINDHPNITGHSIQEKLEWFVFEPLKRTRDGFAEGLDELRKKSQRIAPMSAVENVHPEISERYDIKAFERSYKVALEQAGKEVGNVACKNAAEQAYIAYTGELERAYKEVLAKAPIFVIDALDECSKVDRGILLQSCLRFLATSPPLKIFLTSRPEEDIVTLLHDSQYNKQVRQAGSQASPSAHDDITLYAKAHLGEILCPSDIDLFVNRANGLFIWASTAKQFLKEADDLSACFSNLMSQDTKESPIYSLYDTILRSAVDSIGRDQDGRRRLKRVLQGVCAAREPLGTIEMDELLGMSKGVAHLVVKKRLSSVLSGGSEGVSIQALHPTFIEYLRSGSQQPESMIFSYGEAETLLASGCLNALTSGQLHYDVCGIMGPDRFAPNNEDIEDLKWRLEENTTPGLRYAADHGLSHVRSRLGDDAVILQLREFFEKYSLYWIELMSLLGKIYHLTYSVHYLKLQIEKSMANSIGLLTTADKGWCEEIHSLVQPFQATIQDSALQVYFSALAFTPSTSRICHFYGQDFVDRIPKVLRGAWRVQSQYTVLSGHAGPVHCLPSSPDGQRLASGSRGKIVWLWDATTGTAIGDRLTGHIGGVAYLSFSPDGQKIASSSWDKTVRLWDAKTSTAIGEPLSGHTGEVTCLSFSSNSRSLASGSSDHTIRLWDATTGAAIGEPLSGHTGSVTCLSLSPNGRQLASGSWDNTIRFWDATTGGADGEPLTGHTNHVECLSFSPDGRSLASGSRDHTIRFWDAKTGTAIGEPLSGHTSGVTCLSFSPDGRSLASGSRDHLIRLWDATTGTAIGEPLSGHTGWVTCLSFSPNARQLASGSKDYTVRLWDAKKGAATGEPLTGHTGEVNCLSLSPDGRTIASGSGDGSVRLWNATTGAAVGEPLTGHISVVTCLSFSPDGRQLASGSWDCAVRLWDATPGAYVGEKQTGHASTVISLCFSPDGQHLASGSTDCTIRLWDTTTGAAIGEPLTGHNGIVSCFSFSPDGRVLASGSTDHTICLWDVASGAEVGEPLSGHTDGVNYISFSPDSQILASASWDYTVQLWDVPSGATVGQSVRYDRYIRSTALYMHDSSLFLAVDGGAVDSRPVFWRLSEDALIKLPPGHQPPALPVFPSRAKFDYPWTYILSSTGFHFSLPSSFQCSQFLSHEQKLAYGGVDGSVIIIDCSHLV